ncbi:MAG: hypothetical protein PHT96_14360 [Syntrophorhabdaceae bacterium]|nr:hypothetical protein [Syntrophorhabdaceae bacterium]MDD4197569.1 hypothetical protein [Syntrophorhabdaceae bacterium]
MNEQERMFRTSMAPALRNLARLCRLNENAFVTIVEIEPGKMVRLSYLPEKSTLKRPLVTRLCTTDNNEYFKAERLNEENINIVRGIRAELG